MFVEARRHGRQFGYTCSQIDGRLRQGLDEPRKS